MNIFSTSEFRVGFLVTVVLAIFGVMTLQVSEDPAMYGRTRRTSFVIDDASGLVKHSAVKMAGIGIGVIKEIKLENGKARIELALRKDIPITKATSVEIRANGILGDKYIEIVPGDPNAESLPDGTPIASVRNNGSMDEIVNQVGKVTQSLNEVAESLRSAATGEGNVNTPLGRILKNIEVISADLREFTQGNKSKLSQIVDNLHNTTESLNDLVNDPSDSGFKASWNAAVKSLQRIDRSLANIEEITDKVNNGKGTIGQLVNDDQTINEINNAVQGVNQMLGSTTKIQTSLDFHSEFLTEQNLFKTYLGVKIQPGLDRYYEVQVVDDPKGVVETTQTQTTTDPGGPSGSTPTVTERKTFKNRVKFTGLFAKNFYDFTVKGGLIENSGGIGVDYYFVRRKFRFSTELFDVRENVGARLRSSLRYNIVHGVYLIGGADDYLRRSNYSSYLGAGLDLTNDDLKALLGKVSF